MTSPISTIGKSLIRHIVDTVEIINETTEHQAVYWSFETRADEDKLPKETLIGLDNLAFEEREGLWDISCAIAISSYMDKNLLNELELLDIIYERCSWKKKVLLLDPIDGDELDMLVVTDFQITPMVQSMHRNYRTVMLTLKRTSSALS